MGYNIPADHHGPRPCDIQPTATVKHDKSTPPPNPKQVFGDRKVPMHLWPMSATVEGALAFREGRKYGPFNWRDTPVEAMTYVGALLRHMAAWIDGESIDPDGSGKTHLGGALACLAILVDATHCGTLIDNRPPPGQAGPAIRALAKEPSP